MSLELEQLLPSVLGIARRAGAVVMEVYQSPDFDVQLKSDESPLTRADIASNKIIVEGLKTLTPEVPILSEESKQVPYSDRKGWTTYWLVDPLDGTKEFVKRNGEFTVNIALVDDGEPVLGVVYAPVLGRMYYAAKGQGAFRADGDGEPRPIRAADYHDASLKIVASRSHAGPDLAAFLDRVGDYEVVSMGSSLKLCLVADGTAHLYPRLGPTMEWDTGAAHAIVNEAGGAVTDLDNVALCYNKEDLLNPSFMVVGNPAYPWAAALNG
jgi:3'(2'), 5'-bisphosphate nucleotidase